MRTNPAAGGQTLRHDMFLTGFQMLGQLTPCSLGVWDSRPDGQDISALDYGLKASSTSNTMGRIVCRLSQHSESRAFGVVLSSRLIANVLNRLSRARRIRLIANTGLFPALTDQFAFMTAQARSPWTEISFCQHCFGRRCLWGCISRG